MAKSKPQFVTSCCGRPIEDCPGCPEGMMLIPKDTDGDEDMDKEIDESLQPIFKKIESGTVTTDDFNALMEATPESARDRLRRRSMAQRDTVKSHQDNETGHADLELPTFNDRIQPKRERADRTQMQHRGRLGHRHSARTQRRTQQENRFEVALGFLVENFGKPFDEYQELLADIEDKAAVAIVARRLMTKPGINRDWLYDVCRNLEHDRRNGR